MLSGDMVTLDSVFTTKVLDESILVSVSGVDTVLRTLPTLT